ncbi:alpha-tocopherol transfer protein-like [Cimex lectularius]|uniref:CRAL-TRIO domain-containing protein n=1 Tax=Cimex lectularius TaxID=79782 RepID=A0A8I6SPR2_CIMLE|nr:alpha-tocopherol transfer protein-like [Cimex lectularius]
MPELVYEDTVGDVEADLDLCTVPDDVKEFARVRLGETPEKRMEMLDELRELIYERGEFEPLRMDDDYLTRFLRARNYKLEPTYRLLNNYCNFREENYEYYDGVNPMNLYRIGDANILSVLPYRDQNGRRILIYRLGKWIPSEVPMEDLFKASIATLEAGILEPRAQILGGVAIFDMADLSMTQAWYMTPSVASKVQEIMATSFPMKISAIHIVNESWVFEKVYSMFKPFLTTRYKDILFFHGSDMNSLHKHIDPKFLPESYGGKRPEFHYAEWFRKLTKNRAVVEAMTELGYKTEYNEDNSDEDDVKDKDE